MRLPHSAGKPFAIDQPGMRFDMPTLRARVHVCSALCLLIASMMAACAAAPETASSNSSPLDRIKPFESGNVTAAGVYMPSEAERALDCKKLTGSMRIIIARLRDAGNRPQASLPAAAAQGVVATIRGQPSALDMDAELIRERGRLTAYNRLLADKKCPTLDLTKELAPTARK